MTRLELAYKVAYWTQITGRYAGLTLIWVLFLAVAIPAGLFAAPGMVIRYLIEKAGEALAKKH